MNTYTDEQIILMNELIADSDRVKTQRRRDAEERAELKRLADEDELI